MSSWWSFFPDARDNPKAQEALAEVAARYLDAKESVKETLEAAADAKADAEAAAAAEEEALHPKPITHNPVCALYSAHDVLAKEFDYEVAYKNIAILDPEICNFHISRNKASDMHLFYMQNVIYSFLVPDIRIFKVVREKREVADASKVGNLSIKDVVEIEFPRSLSHVRRQFDELSSYSEPAGMIVESKVHDDRFFSSPVLDREDQIGIKSFSWNYIGNDSFTAERDIEAELTLAMDGIGAMFVARTNWQGKSYVIADILLQSDCFKTSEQTNPNEPDKTNSIINRTNAASPYHPECYEILIEAGWRVDLERLKANIAEGKLENYSIFSGDKNAEILLKEISKMDFERMKSCMYLTPVDHTFSIKEDGSAECNITYRARLSQAMRDAQANILMEKKAKERLNTIQKEIDRLSKMANKSEVDKRKLKTKQEEKKKVIEEAANKFGSEVLKIIKGEKGQKDENGNPVSRYFVFKMNETDLKLYSQFLSEPSKINWLAYRNYLVKRALPPSNAQVATSEASPPESRGVINNLAIPVINAAVDYLNSVSGIALDISVGEINYFYFADLVDAVMEFAGRENFANYRLVLGSVEVPDLDNPEKTNRISIASIPISQEMFQNFVTKQIQEPSADSMSITKFIDLFMTQMLPESLGRQCYDNLFPDREEIKFRNTQMVHYQNGSNEDPTTHVEKEFLDCNFLAKISSGCSDLVQNVEQETGNFLPPLLISVLHQERSSDFVTDLGNIYKDFDNKIPHFKFGQAYGLIKKVTLQKTDLPFQREHRYTMSGGDRFTLLTNVYNATFEMIGNDLNTIGGLIYLDPSSLAPSGILGSPNNPNDFAYIMGLGGAHLITKISHRMSPGNYSTSVQTVWENRGQLKIDTDKKEAEQASRGSVSK